MNIFVLDRDPEKAAQYHMDKHVVKMCLEYAQLLATSARLMGYSHDGYKNTHENHPCTQWAAEDLRNWAWLHRLLSETASEYTRRYGRVHTSYAATQGWVRGVGPLYTATLRKLPTPRRFALAMPEELRGADAVKSYREYYLTKRAFATWKSPSATPRWFQEAAARSDAQLSLSLSE